MRATTITKTCTFTNILVIDACCKKMKFALHPDNMNYVPNMTNKLEIKVPGTVGRDISDHDKYYEMPWKYCPWCGKAIEWEFSPGIEEIQPAIRKLDSED